jgi:hypothetical protein
MARARARLERRSAGRRWDALIGLERLQSRPSSPDKIEALLLSASALREQLAATNDDCQRARGDLISVRKSLSPDDQTPIDRSMAAAPNAPDPTDRVGLICKTYAELSETMQSDSQRIGVLAHDLDEIYTDISAKLPRLDIKKMEAGRRREETFAPVKEEDGEEYHVRYSLAAGVTRSCVAFTQELSPDISLYKPYVSATFEKFAGDPKPAVENADDSQPPPQQAQKPLPVWSLSVAHNTLCLDNLAPGAIYSVVLKQGLPSKFGVKLAQDVPKRECEVPSYPKQIHFSGGRFVLPKRSDRTIEAHVTNLRKFDAELFRDHRSNALSANRTRIFQRFAHRLGQVAQRRIQRPERALWRTALARLDSYANELEAQ